MYCFAFNDPAPHHHHWNHLTTITIVQNMESLEYHECCVDWLWSWKHEFYGNTNPCWWLYLWWGGGLTMTLMSHLALWILIGLYPTTLPQYNAATVTMGGERCHKRSRWHRGRIWTRSERVIGQHLNRHHQVVGCCRFTICFKWSGYVIVIEKHICRGFQWTSDGTGCVECKHISRSDLYSNTIE